MLGYAATVHRSQGMTVDTAGLAPDIVETHGVWRGEHNNPALDSLLRPTEAAA